MHRNTYVEIDLEALSQNVKNIIKKYDYKYYIGVVKGNAYGHGYGIIDTLIESGINFLAVANLDEALEIRKINKDIKILCLEPIDKKYLDICSKENVSIMIDDYEYYNEIKDLKLNLNLHLKIDSGMNRLGFNNKEEVDKFYKDLKNKKNFHLEGIFTHFATAGIYDKSYDNQVNRFKNLVSSIDLSKIDIVHLDRSVTMCAHEKLDFVNGVRLGIIMYGFEVMHKEGNTLKDKLRKIKWNFLRKKQNISEPKSYEKLELKTAFNLISEVLEVKKVKKGDFIGYGNVYEAEEDMMVAIIDIGYADGISKRRFNSSMQINDKVYPIVGDVCMGMTMLKVDENVKKHDKVIVIGDKISIRSVASHIHTSVYEVMLMIDSNITRKYRCSNGKDTFIR